MLRAVNLVLRIGLSVMLSAQFSVRPAHVVIFRNFDGSWYFYYIIHPKIWRKIMYKEHFASLILFLG